MKTKKLRLPRKKKKQLKKTLQGFLLYKMQIDPNLKLFPYEQNVEWSKKLEEFLTKYPVEPQEIKYEWSIDLSDLK